MSSRITETDTEREKQAVKRGGYRKQRKKLGLLAYRCENKPQASWHPIKIEPPPDSFLCVLLGQHVKKCRIAECPAASRCQRPKL